MNSGELGRSKEDYLEAILVVIREKGACRSTDIAAQVHYSKPSVSVALHKLEDDGLVVRDDWRVLLTEEGRKVAEQTLEKHMFFLRLFESVGVDHRTAEKEACAVEHLISEDSFRKMQAGLKPVTGGQIDQWNTGEKNP
ncbi:MAG: metal-dependent transcriptional regulator [Lachnospiraceae bacterium]|nr:metal-dependent transcriptional regulator [Lachnospiraceae bacterium]